MKLLFSPWPGLSKHSCTSKNIKASFNCCSALRSHICTWELFLFAVNSLQNSVHLPEMDITPPRMAWLAMWWRNTYCLKQLHTQLSHPMERICQSIIVYIHHMVPRRDTYGTPLQYEQAEEEEEEEGEEEQTRHSLRQVPTLRSPRLQNSCGRIWTKQISLQNSRGRIWTKPIIIKARQIPTLRLRRLLNSRGSVSPTPKLNNTQGS